MATPRPSAPTRRDAAVSALWSRRLGGHEAGRPAQAGGGLSRAVRLRVRAQGVPSGREQRLRDGRPASPRESPPGRPSAGRPPAGTVALPDGADPAARPAGPRTRAGGEPLPPPRGEGPAARAQGPLPWWRPGVWTWTLVESVVSEQDSGPGRRGGGRARPRGQGLPCGQWVPASRRPRGRSCSEPPRSAPRGQRGRGRADAGVTCRGLSGPQARLGLGAALAGGSAAATCPPLSHHLGAARDAEAPPRVFPSHSVPWAR